LTLALRILISSTAVFANDNNLSNYNNSSYSGYCYSYKSGNEAEVFGDTIGVDGYNFFGGRLFSITDIIEWTVNKKTKKFGPFNYSTGVLLFTKPWWSLWTKVGSADTSVWYDEETQKEATSALGAGFGIGLKGSAEASKTSGKASGTLDVTIGQVVAYWGSTSINTVSGYSNVVRLSRRCTVVK